MQVLIMTAPVSTHPEDLQVVLVYRSEPGDVVLIDRVGSPVSNVMQLENCLHLRYDDSHGFFGGLVRRFAGPECTIEVFHGNMDSLVNFPREV